MIVFILVRVLLLPLSMVHLKFSPSSQRFCRSSSVLVVSFLGLVYSSVSLLFYDSQEVSTISRTRRVYSLRFSRYKFAASALAGEFGLGSWSRDWIEVRIAATSYVGDHRFCKMSRHNSPFAYTFGWNIFDTNLTVGGLFGYVSSNWRSNLNVPSSNGVSPRR